MGTNFFLIKPPLMSIRNEMKDSPVPATKKVGLVILLVHFLFVSSLHLNKTPHLKKDQSKPKVSILKAFTTIIWPRRKMVFIGLLLIVVSKIASFVAPLSLKILMD